MISVSYPKKDYSSEARKTLYKYFGPLVVASLHIVTKHRPSSEQGFRVFVVMMSLPVVSPAR